MKRFYYIALSILAATASVGCSNDETVAFGIDSNTFSIEAVGGTRLFKVSASDNWVASASVPWITVSPANGKGSKECSLIIDSALTSQVRTGVVRIARVDNSAEYQEIQISQQGFDYAITLDDAAVNIDNYAAIDQRYVDVVVNTNVDFNVKVPDEAASWVKVEKGEVLFDRGLRPRQVSLHILWGINSIPQERIAELSFEPISEGVTSDMLVRNDKLVITQNAADQIEVDSRAGDSVALLGIARSLGVWANEWESSGDKMDNWDGVTLWEEGMPGYDPSLKGRVKSARFFMFSTKDGIPFEVQYLTAAEELEFYSNTNTFLLSLNTGEYICQLTQLKRLTIGAYGLTELHENFTNLRNLEYLDLGSNNFEQVPDILTPENFPKLHALKMANNQRKLIYDLSNTTSTNFGGLFAETAHSDTGFGAFPEWLLRWEPGTNSKGEAVTGLDTLVLSVNYLQGTIPSFVDDATVGYYTETDITNSADTLPTQLLQVKRVMPQLKQLSLNLNRLTGELPQWLLLHPSLDWWDPYTLLFIQEGKDELGNLAGFTNTPANLNEYYSVYTKKVLANSSSGSTGTTGTTETTGR